MRKSRVIIEFDIEIANVYYDEIDVGISKSLLWLSGV